MIDAFVSPAQVDEARLSKAAGWFARAHGRTSDPGHTDLHETTWRTVAFTHKSDLRSEPQPYPETGKWITRLHSSGTTAEPVFSPWSEVDQQIADATALKVHARCPSLQGAQCAVIAPGPPLAAAHFVLREIELSGGVPYLIAPGDPEMTLRTLTEQGIDVVFTLPLVASRLGEYYHANRRGPHGVSTVFCVGDILAPARQAMLAAMWDARVLNMFGCSELFGPVAGPSEAGGPLVWCCDPVAVEVINPDSMAPCGVGERGVLVVTTLWPKASPLQRYWTEDIVEVTQISHDNGAFAFHYIGRPPSMLQTTGGPVPLREIDELLLGAGMCASEWSVRQTSAGICVEAEMLTRTPDATRHIKDAMTEFMGAPVKFVPHEPGSLPRTVPKFCVAR